MKNTFFFAIAILKRALLGLLIITAFSGIVMLLWNFWVPEILGLKAITFWQAAAMFALMRILFGHFGGDHHGDHHFGRHDLGNSNPLREKWMEMADEERKIFFNRRKNVPGDQPFSREDFWKRRSNRANQDDATEGEQ
jgi:Ca2+/H+ antiporter, TMEM165/GDT1 family